MDPITILLAGCGGIFAGGCAWGGAKAALNGTRKNVADLKGEFTAHTMEDRVQQTQTIERLARIETKLDMLTDGNS